MARRPPTVRASRRTLPGHEAMSPDGHWLSVAPVGADPTRLLSPDSRPDGVDLRAVDLKATRSTAGHPTQSVGRIQNLGRRRDSEDPATESLESPLRVRELPHRPGRTRTDDEVDLVAQEQLEELQNLGDPRCCPSGSI